MKDDEWHRGSWMQTYTGRAFYPLAPRAEDIDPIDMAHALAHLCRYGGHVHRFYSVAEHCVLLSHAVSPENARWALLHDASEAYCADLPRPIKRSLPAYSEVEEGILAALAERFGLPGECPREVKEAGSRILLDERAALLGASPQEWSVEHLSPLGVTISAWTPGEAKANYLARLRELFTECGYRASRPPFSR